MGVMEALLWGMGLISSSSSWGNPASQTLHTIHLPSSVPVTATVITDYFLPRIAKSLEAGAVKPAVVPSSCLLSDLASFCLLRSGFARRRLLRSGFARRRLLRSGFTRHRLLRSGFARRRLLRSGSSSLIWVVFSDLGLLDVVFSDLGQNHRQMVRSNRRIVVPVRSYGGGEEDMVEIRMKNKPSYVATSAYVATTWRVHGANI
ncbi:hypothetical protein LINGRAHAP2_LOCUS22652 [Linum grandiflorum]